MLVVLRELINWMKVSMLTKQLGGLLILVDTPFVFDDGSSGVLVEYQWQDFRFFTRYEKSFNILFLPTDILHACKKIVSRQSFAIFI